jgi:hypothetical protein
VYAVTGRRGLGRSRIAVAAWNQPPGLVAVTHAVIQAFRSAVATVWVLAVAAIDLHEPVLVEQRNVNTLLAARDAGLGETTCIKVVRDDLGVPGQRGPRVRRPRLRSTTYLQVSVLASSSVSISMLG